MSITQAALADINARDLLTLTAEVHIGDGKTVATTNRWKSLGAVPSLEYAPNAENKAVPVAVRGIIRTAKSHTSRIEPKYTATMRELSKKVMEMIFFEDTAHDFGAAGADNAQSGLSAASGSAFDLDEGSDGEGVAIGDRTDVLDSSGNHVLAITALVLAGVEEAYGAGGDSTTLAEGIDYELDADIGQVRWLKAINDDVITPTITSATIAATSTNYMTKAKPNRVGYVEKLCRIYWFDQDSDSNWVIWHKDFLARFSVGRGFTADGEATAEPQLMIEVLSDGEVWKRTA